MIVTINKCVKFYVKKKNMCEDNVKDRFGD
jgi:hypothetical protein